MAVLTILMVILPRAYKKLPIPFVMKKEDAFFKASIKAYMAEMQKLSPVNAT